MYLKTLLSLVSCIVLTSVVFAQAPYLPSYTKPPSKLQNESVQSRPPYSLWIRPYDVDTAWRLSIMAEQQRALDAKFRRQFTVYRIVDNEATAGVQSPRDYSHEENRRLRKFTDPATLGIQIDSTGEPYMFRRSLAGY